MQAGRADNLLGVAFRGRHQPIVARIDAPAAEPLSAFTPADRISLDNPSFAPGDAARLDDLTLNSALRSLTTRTSVDSGHLDI